MAGHDFDEFSGYTAPAAGGGGHDFDEFGGGGEAAKDEPGFFERAKQSLQQGVHALKHVGREAGEHFVEGIKHPVESLLHPVDFAKSSILGDPSKRRELERGVGDVVTLGYGNKLAARVGNALGDEARGTSINEQLHFEPDSSGHRMAGQGAGTTSEIEAADAANAPEYRVAGNWIGSILPNPGSKLIGPLAGKALSPIAKAVAPAAEKAISKVASIPIAGKALAPLAAGAAGAAKGVAEYEASAPLTAALSANAEGHRHQAAHEAALDPAGLLLSGALGAVPKAAQEAARGVKTYAEGAQKAADAWIAKDIAGEVKGASTPTARKQMTRAAENFPEVVGKDPELRDAISEARHGDLPKVQKVADLLDKKLDEVQEAKPELYRQVDEALPHGGVRAGDVVKAYEDDIAARRATGHDYDAKIAAELERRVKLIKGASNWGAGREVFDPDVSVGGERAGDLVARYEQMRSNAKTPKQVAALSEAIDGIKSQATKQGFDPNHVVSTRQLRRLVTDAQRTAFEGEGGINGTEQYARRLDVAATPEKILADQLEQASGAKPQAVKDIAQMDLDTHTLLAAKKVIDQRLETSKQNALGASTSAHTGSAIKKLVHSNAVLLAAERAYHGHPGQAAAVLAAAAAPAIKRGLDVRTARFMSTPGGRQAVARLIGVARTTANVGDFVRGAVSAGMAADDARRIWEGSRRINTEASP